VDDHRDQDQDVVVALQTMFESLDPVPPLVTEAAKAALAWRRIDAELAELLSDSSDEAQLAPAARRSAASVLRVTFGTGDLTVNLEIHAEGPERTLLGQLAPPATAKIEIQTSDDATAAAIQTDSLGRFRAELTGRRTIRLRILPQGVTSSRWLETSWITI